MFPLTKLLSVKAITFFSSTDAQELPFGILSLSKLPEIKVIIFSFSSVVCGKTPSGHVSAQLSCC